MDMNLSKLKKIMKDREASLGSSRGKPWAKFQGPAVCWKFQGKGIVESEMTQERELANNRYIFKSTAVGHHNPTELYKVHPTEIS